MWKKFLKKYGKMMAAAGFLTVAGLCYGFADSREDSVVLRDPGQQVYETEIAVSESEETEVFTCYVHICGEVNAPGVYELPEGSRIFEAVEAAGGFTDEASEESLNLAGVVSDGMQIVILSKEEVRAIKEAQGAVSGGLVNINKASREQLMTLPGVGESRAEDIIRYREESGGFQTIEEIMKVPGIKDAAFQKIKDSIAV